jgi:hypothetical protein
VQKPLNPFYANIRRRTQACALDTNSADTRVPHLRRRFFSPRWDCSFPNTILRATRLATNAAGASHKNRMLPVFGFETRLLAITRHGEHEYDPIGCRTPKAMPLTRGFREATKEHLTNDFPACARRVDASALPDTRIYPQARP